MYSENSEQEEENLVQRMIGKTGSTQFFIVFPILIIIIIVCSVIYFTKAYNHFSNTSKHVHFSDELTLYSE